MGDLLSDLNSYDRPGN